jgi:DUF4097 and DUF4098 domain-containing protein YvlB
LVALEASVRSSNAAISGTYKVASSLDLTTSNGNIKVAAEINGTETLKTLNLRTSNS